ncbi:hypothetical protein IF188_05580 [Microbacterium sp. NEAU-LLC]|uniref:Uncharacterized protein n=1 Tax=Microbacterium helvum TaxID=2773713 RepID=A0ABR8NL87_9MICO|nr:hypothetical protein [Microbacterium helvum]MBD3941168.1 hypothetical protein [Microbacterium helvum]
MMTDPAEGAEGAAPPTTVLAQISRVTWMLIGLSVPVTILAMYLAALDPEGETWWGLIMFAVPGLITAYAVIESLWAGRDVLASPLVRMFLVPAVSSVVSAATIAIAYVLPPVQQALADTRDPGGWHYWFDAEEGNPWLLSLFAGLGLGLLAGLVAWVFVVLPVSAIRRPREFAEASGATVDDEDFESARRAGIAMAFLLVLVFLIPSLIIFGAQGAHADSPGELFARIPEVIAYPGESVGEIAWLIGMLLIPVGVWLLWYVATAQRRAGRRR